MKNPNRDLRDLFARFLGVEEAKAASEEIQSAEKWLELYPTPEASPEVIAQIKHKVAARLARRHRLKHAVHRFVGAAAAIVVVAMIGLLGRGPADRPEVSYASLIPAAIWDSDDISSDDTELAYFTAEIERIEAQMRALEAGESEDTGIETLGEVEVELLRIDTEFWKE